MLWTVHKYGPQRYQHAAATIGTNIFVFGGYSNQYFDHVYEPIDVCVLDTVKLKWLYLVLKDQDTDCVPLERCGHTVVALGSNIYLWGGSSGIEVSNTLYCFDTNTLKWSKPHVKGNIPIARRCHSACVIKNCMYIFGGLQKSVGFASDLYMFDFKRMMWSLVVTTGLPPSARFHHTATAIDDKMYIYGGRSQYFLPNQTNDVYCSLMSYLDTSTLTWTTPQTGGDSPIPRFGHSAFVYNGFIYIFGGHNRNKPLHFNDLNRYDPVGCTWTKLFPRGRPPCSRRKQICQVLGNRIFICGGISSYPTNYSIYGVEEHGDLHVLDMNPSLKDICLVDLASERFKAMNIDDLCIPVSLKHELEELKSIELIENDDMT